MNIKARLFPEGVSARSTVIKNVAWLFSGQIVGRLIRAGIVVYAARVLGAAHWGAFAYALGIVTFLTVFSDIGINGLITKETARDESLRDRYLGTAFFLKLILIGLVFSGIFLLFPRFSSIPEATTLMPILVFVFAFDTLRDLMSAVSRALEKMHLEATSTILTNVAIVVLGAGALLIRPNTTSLALAYAIGSGAGMFASFFVLRRNFRNLFTSFTRSLLKPIITTAWPFGLLAMLGAIMLNTDIIMIGSLGTPTQVGYYSAAQKIIQLLYVLPAFLATGIFPLMSRLAKNNSEGADRVLGKSLALVIMLALPITIGGIFGAPFIIRLFFGAEYIPATLSLRILMLTLPITYPAMILGNAAFAYDEQKKFIPFVLAAALSNIILNALLIPVFGIAGASAATIVAQLTSNIFIWRSMKRISGFRVYSHIKTYLGL